MIGLSGNIGISFDDVIQDNGTINVQDKLQVQLNVTQLLSVVT